MNIAFCLLWHTASRRRLPKPTVTPELQRTIQRRMLSGLPVYSAATLIALYNAYAGMALCSTLWILWALTDYESL